MCIKKHTGRRDIGASQKRGDRPALRAAAPTQRGLSSLQPSARTSQREGVPHHLQLAFGLMDKDVLCANMTITAGVDSGSL